jgi:hypothetical protein
VAAELQKAGLQVQSLEGRRGISVWACNGEVERLFLAHTDSVRKDVPGAVDNAAAVAVLLAFARAGLPSQSCVAFPAAEEIGLVGSQELAKKLHPRLVVALDLVGHGELAVTGLGASWGDESIRWLAGIPVRQVYGYRVVSRAFPEMERSDHASFMGPGVLSMQLLGRGEAGIYPAYHTKADTIEQVSEQALKDCLNAVKELATRPLPEGTPSAAFSAWGLVLPGWAVWLGLWGGAFAGLWQRVDFLKTQQGLWVGIGASGLGAIVWELLASGKPDFTEIDQLSLLGVAAGWVGLPKARLSTQAELFYGFIALILGLGVDPLLGLPWALCAFLIRIKAGWVALYLPLYLLVKQKELAFHFVVPAAGLGHALFWIFLLTPFWMWIASSRLAEVRRSIRLFVLGGLLLFFYLA